MDNNDVQLVGGPCGQHGPYTFYKAFKYTKNGIKRIVTLSEFFFVKMWRDSDLLCIGELQLLWIDKNSEQVLASLRLYFLPENTPEGRMDHGEANMFFYQGITFLLTSFICAWAQQDLDALIGEVFRPPSSTSASLTTSAPPTTPDLQPSVGGIPGTGSCTCVPYYLCNNGTINTNGEGIIDIRIQEGPCGSYIEVCCNKEDQVTVPITPPPPPIEPPKGCGYRHPDGVGFRITGDKENESQFGEFPWMVAILREESVEGNPQKLNVYQCGGALIHPQVAVTGAHCVSGKNKSYKIRAGEWDTQHTQELYPHQDREVQTISIHPQYYAGALYNDIALLFLKSPVEITKNVDVVCLPPQDTVIETGRCIATGWGKDVFGKKGKYQVILKKIDLPIVPRGTCQDKLRETRLGKYFELHRSFICAGGEPDKDTCKGDGGSPLICPIGGRGERYYQAGIVAWGIGCGQTDTPGVYVNVAVFRDWIDEQMKFNNLDLSSYQY